MIPIMQSEADKISVITSLTSTQYCGGFQAFFWKKKDLQSSFNILNMEQELYPLPIHKHLKHLLPSQLINPHSSALQTFKFFPQIYHSRGVYTMFNQHLPALSTPHNLTGSGVTKDHYENSQVWWWGPHQYPKPLCHYQTTSPWHVFSSFCTPKCSSNGSIIIEALIKILLGITLVLRSTTHCGVQTQSSRSLVESSKGTNPDPKPLTDDTGVWFAFWTSMVCTHRAAFQCHFHFPHCHLNASISKHQTCEERAHGAHRPTIRWLLSLPCLFLSFLCAHISPPSSDLHFCYSYFLTCSTTAIEAFSTSLTSLQSP